MPFDATDEEIKWFFSPLGMVMDVHIVKDYQTGKSRGFGFITMRTEEEALTLLEKDRKLKIRERPVVIKIAKERNEQKNLYQKH